MKCTDCGGSGRYVGLLWDSGPCRRCGGSGLEPSDEREPEPEAEPEPEPEPAHFDDEVESVLGQTKCPVPQTIAPPSLRTFFSIYSMKIPARNMAWANIECPHSYYRVQAEKLSFWALDSAGVNVGFHVRLQEIQYMANTLFSHYAGGVPLSIVAEVKITPIELYASGQGIQVQLESTYDFDLEFFVRTEGIILP